MKQDFQAIKQRWQVNHNIQCIRYHCPLWQGFDKCSLGRLPDKCGLDEPQMREIEKAVKGEGRLILNTGRCSQCGGLGKVTKRGHTEVWTEPCPACSLLRYNSWTGQFDMRPYWVRGGK